MQAVAVLLQLTRIPLRLASQIAQFHRDALTNLAPGPEGVINRRQVLQTLPSRRQPTDHRPLLSVEELVDPLAQFTEPLGMRKPLPFGGERRLLALADGCIGEFLVLKPKEILLLTPLLQRTEGVIQLPPPGLPPPNPAKGLAGLPFSSISPRSNCARLALSESRS